MLHGLSLSGLIVIAVMKSRASLSPGEHNDFRLQPEEQQVDETYEQFEERVLNKRAGHMYHIVKSKLMRSDKLYLSEMVHRNNRKQVWLCS